MGADRNQNARRLRRAAACTGVVLLMAGCGDPLRNVETLSAVDLAVAEAANIAVEADAPATAQAGGEGFLGRLFGRGAAPEGASEVAMAATDTATTGPIEAGMAVAPDDEAETSAVEATPEEVQDVAIAAPEEEVAPVRRGGLFGLFRARADQGEPNAEPQPAVVADAEGAAEIADTAETQDIAASLDGALSDDKADLGAEETDVTLASAAADPEAAQATAAAPEAERRGLFGGLFNARANETPEVPTGPDRIQIPDGMNVPYGRIATNCDVGRRAMGTRIARQSGFEVWDSSQGSTEPRSHYITGFADGCARQFTAALVITGDVGTHEIVRYSDVSLDQPYSAVDNAYERIKNRFCSSRRARPCGARLEALGNVTMFVTAYPRFGAGPEWVEILLHEGEVIEMTEEDI